MTDMVPVRDVVLQQRRAVRTLAPTAADLVDQYDGETTRELFDTTADCAKRRYFMGRSFRVGWGPNGTLVCPQVLLRAEGDRYVFAPLCPVTAWRG